MLRLLLLVLFCIGAAATLVKFENGSYTDIIVAFDRGHLMRDHEVVKGGFIHTFMKLIKLASHVLYNATNGLAYFKKVWIIYGFEKYPYNPGKIVNRSVFFPRADIRIGSPNVEYGSPDAFTLQTGQCGEQGKFIFLSDSFIRDSENTTKLAARRVVQERVRYRYGVFDEQESFLWEGKEISPATCVDGIKGWAMTENHERCVLNCGRVGSTCRFFPDLKNNSGVVSSMMSYPHLTDVKLFCNISNHNRKAPSMQNKMCNSKSIMEVIRKHKDFKDAHQWLNTRKKVLPPETNIFGIVDVWLKIVFVVESSEMMEKENGTQEVQDFIQRFFMHLGPKRAWSYFYKFSNELQLLWWVVKVGNESFWQKDDILNVSRPVVSQSATPDIGKALKEILKDGPMFFPMIILISTGNGKIDELKQYKSWKKNDERLPTIHSIVVGQRLNWTVDRLSQMHGGDSYFLGDNGSGSGEPRTFNLDMAFLASMHAVADGVEQPVVIRYERFTLKRKWEPYDYYFLVDDGIGKDLVVTFSQNYIMYKLFNPHLDSPPEETHEYGYGSIAKSIVVNDAEPGRWTLELRRDYRQEEDYVDVMIMATPRTRCSLQGSCVLVRAWIGNVTEDKKGKGTKEYHRIYAEVKWGYSPVIDATVIATVQVPGQEVSIKVALKDNGAAPDRFKDDGIYSHYFPVMQRPVGRSIVIVRVSNEDGNAGVKIASCKNSRSTYRMLDEDDYKRAIKEFGESKSRFSAEDFARLSTSDYQCKQRKESERVCVLPLSLFERVTMANSPILFPMNEDEVLKTPPADIWDLKVVQEFKRGNGFSMLLQWTSPEHPRQGMKVERIEVCGSRNQNFVTSKECSSANTIYNISRGIAPAGEVQRFEVKIPESMVIDSAGKVHNLYFALRARDQRGNSGEMSNVAEAFFERIDVKGVKEREESVKEEGEAAKGKAGSRSWVPWTIGVVVVIVVAAVGAVGYLMWKKKKEGWMPNARVTFQQKESEHSC